MASSVRTKTLMIQLAGIGLGFAGPTVGGLVPAWHVPGRVVGGLGATLAAVACLRQFRSGTPYVRAFEPDDWTPAGGQFRLVVPAAAHRQTHVRSTVVAERTANGYEVIFCDSWVGDDGAVTLVSNLQFKGRITIA